MRGRLRQLFFLEVEPHIVLDIAGPPALTNHNYGLVLVKSLFHFCLLLFVCLGTDRMCFEFKKFVV